MTATSTCYHVRPLRVEDLPAVLDLLSTALAGGPTGRRTAEFFAWKHQCSPFGPSLGLVAEADGRLLGVRLLLRWRFTVDGQPVEAVRPVDTATHPDHRGRGVFRRLTMAGLDLAAADTSLVFNTPNSQSLPGYLKMGWSRVGRLPVALAPVRPLRFLLHVRGAGRGTSPGPRRPSDLRRAAAVLEDPRVSDLLSAVRRDPGRLLTDRSLAYLRWRYGQAPLDYRALTVEVGNELVGLGFGRLRQRGALLEFTLSEVLVPDGDVASAAAVLREARRTGCDHVAAHFAPGSEAATAALTRGYVTVPRQGITLAARTLQPVDPDPFVPESWRLSLGDLEVF